MQDDCNRPLDLATAGAHHREHKRSLGLKKSTLTDYEGYLRVHLAPFFGSTPLDEIDLEMLEAFVRAEQEAGLAPKSILNHLVLLNGIFNHALKRGWCKHNPVSCSTNHAPLATPTSASSPCPRSRRSLLRRRQPSSAVSTGSSTSRRS